MNHKELLEHLLNGGSIVDSDGNTAKIVVGEVHHVGDTTPWVKPDLRRSWSIYKPKAKKTFWFVSAQLDKRSRIFSQLYLDKHMTDGLYRMYKDRQLHSIEIEVDDE